MRRWRLALVVSLAILGLGGAGFVVAGGGSALTGATADEPADRAGAPALVRPADQPRFAQATAIDGLAVVIERSKRRPAPGRETTYTIAVANRGLLGESVVVRAVVPPWLATAAPPPGAEPGDGFVDWPVTIAPGGVAELRFTGSYAAPGPQAPKRVAFTACAYDRPGGAPIVCATDVAELQTPSWPGLWWAAGLAGLAVVTGAGAGLIRRLRRGASWLARRSRAPRRASRRRAAG